MPVVMVSSLTAAGSSLTLEALEIGALDAIVKRQPGDDAGLRAYIEEIQSKLINAGRANVSGHYPPAHLSLPRAKLTSWRQKVIQAPAASATVHRVLVIGASTGGPQALRSVLASLKPEGVSVIVAQHISEQFVSSLAERLDDASAFDVAVANHGDALLPGRALIAPGDQNLHVVRAGGELYCHLEAPLPGQVHTPSVDHLFESAARVAGASAVGLVLTGMGQDGAQGLQQLHRKGALTLVQDEASSAVWGMPGAAVQLGAADGDVPLQVIAESLNRLLYKSE